jgi:LPS-assembly protein
VIELALGVFLFFGTQQDQIEITATGPQGWDQRVYRAKDNVIVTYRDVKIEADGVTYDDDTKIVTAGDHVKFTRAEEMLDASSISFNVETKAGDFSSVKGKVGPGFYITAQEAHRTEEGQYQLKNATVTTCDGPRPGWTFSSARAVVDPDKRTAAKGSVFRLESVPLFYMPYLTMPSERRTRATGFLIPSTSTSTTKGRSLRETFYWAINRSADATFTGEYFSKRGPAGEINFRAIPEVNSRIDIASMFAKDRLGQGGQSLRILAFGNLGHDFRGAANMDLVSSFLFRQVYENGINVITSPLQQSVAFASRNTPDLSTNFLYSRNGVFFTSEPTAVLRQFPSAELSFPERLASRRFPIYLSAETGLAAISRRDALITTPGYVGTFDLFPSIEIPLLRSSLADLSQRVSVRETFYNYSRGPQQVFNNPLNRLAFDYSSHFVGPQLERDFGSWRHEIEPTIDYHYVNGAESFRKTIVVDNVDLYNNTNGVEYGITNRLFTTREIFSWRIAQWYFFDPTFGGAIVPGKRNVFTPVLDVSGFAWADGYRRFSPIVSRMRFSTSPSTSTDVQMDYDTRDHLFRSAGIIGNANRGFFTGGVSYFFTKSSPIEVPSNELRGLIAYGNRLKPGFSGALSLSYDVLHSVFQGSTTEVGYNTDCFGLSLELSQFNIGPRIESRLTFSFSLKNVGSVGTLRPRERLF